ncbi:hypothetical protein [Kitasatospora sp. NPDC054795]
MADHVADGDRDAVVRQFDEVVPVAADVERAYGGSVADRGVVAPERSGRGQHGLLECECDFAMAGVGLAQALVESAYTRSGVSRATMPGRARNTAR